MVAFRTPEDGDGLTDEQHHRGMAVFLLALCLTMGRKNKIAVTKAAMQGAMEIMDEGMLPVAIAGLPNGDTAIQLTVDDDEWDWLAVP